MGNPRRYTSTAQQRAMRKIVTNNQGKEQDAKTSLPKKEALRVIPLGGLGEVGKNCMVIEYGDDIIIIDMGMQFPDETMPGIDYIIPDTSYLEENKDRIKGVIITHGHEDHIGAIPYIMPDIDAPVYAPQLPAAFIENKLEEFPRGDEIEIKQINPKNKLKLGEFSIEYFNVNHSIPDSFGVIIHTPEGILVNTGDWKMDLNSPSGEITDLHKLADISKQDPLLLMADSTNAGIPGHTISESEIKRTFEQIFAESEGRIIVSSFSSRIDRFQQILEVAKEYGRKVSLSGRSLQENFEMASRLDYLDYPQDLLIPLQAIGKYPDDKTVILSTGSQGQPRAALSRMAYEEHRQVTIKEGDTVVIAASAIPGNERAIASVINNLRRQGAEVIHGEDVHVDVHETGHASQEEQKLMIKMTKAEYFLPVHGEYHMMATHAETAQEIGMSENDTFVIENGQILEFKDREPQVLDERVSAGIVTVDGLGIGDVGEIVLRDRQAMAEEGMIVLIATVEDQTGRLVTSPDIISRGFVYMREKADLINQIRSEVRKIVDTVKDDPPDDWGYIKNKMREEIGQFVFDETERRPMVLPVIIEV